MKVHPRTDTPKRDTPANEQGGRVLRRGQVDTRGREGAPDAVRDLGGTEPQDPVTGGALGHERVRRDDRIEPVTVDVRREDHPADGRVLAP